MWSGWFAFDEAKRKMEDKLREAQNQDGTAKASEQSNVNSADAEKASPAKVTRSSQTVDNLVEGEPSIRTEQASIDCDISFQERTQSKITNDPPPCLPATVPTQKSRFQTINCFSESELIKKLQEVYSEAKANRVVGPGIQLAEKGARIMAAPASFVLRPCLRICDGPLNVADRVVCNCISCVANVLPIKTQICNETLATSTSLQSNMNTTKECHDKCNS